MLKKFGMLFALLTLLVAPIAPVMHAQVLNSTATVALNLTITESFAVTVSSNSVTVDPTSGLAPAVAVGANYNFGPSRFVSIFSSVSNGGSINPSNVTQSINGGTTTTCNQSISNPNFTSTSACTQIYNAVTAVSGVGTVTPKSVVWGITGLSTMGAGSYTEVVTITAVAV